jgi:hypothetical protein
MALVTVSNNSLTAVTALPASIPTGALTLIKSITASASASISFVDGTDGVVLDGTYSSYVFKFINCHPSTDGVNFQFQVGTGIDDTYNEVITSTYVVSYHYEADTDQAVEYNGAHDQAQGTSFQTLCNSVGADNDQQVSGTLLFNGFADSTYVKHFVADIQNAYSADYTFRHLVAGYVNTPTALSRIQFKMSSGNIDDGIIKLYGVK